jgi:hypothetical protein
MCIPLYVVSMIFFLLVLICSRDLF